MDGAQDTHLKVEFKDQLGEREGKIWKRKRKRNKHLFLIACEKGIFGL